MFSNEPWWSRTEVESEHEVRSSSGGSSGPGPVLFWTVVCSSCLRGCLCLNTLYYLDWCLWCYGASWGAEGVMVDGVAETSPRCVECRRSGAEWPSRCLGKVTRFCCRKVTLTERGYHGNWTVCVCVLMFSGQPHLVFLLSFRSSLWISVFFSVRWNWNSVWSRLGVPSKTLSSL